jgi:uncharacterized membrane protein YdjX (TVP38/TMEM64 family)
MNRRTVRRLIGVLFSLLFVALFVTVSWLIISRFGYALSDPERFRELIRSYGSRGYLLYIALYIMQIICAPIPGQVLQLSSGVLFGIGRGLMVTAVAIVLGGSLAIILTRVIGRRILYYLLDDRAQKFEAAVTRRGLPFILFLALIPNPIGDAVYFLAGLTNLSLTLLIPTMTAARLPGVAIWIVFGDRILKAGLMGGIIGSALLITASLLYLVFHKQYENFFDRMAQRGRWPFARSPR